MSTFEILTLLAALLAVVVSLYTLHEQRKLQREANELQRSTAELAKRQVAEMQLLEEKRQRARLGVDIVQERVGHRFRISNFGDCDAYEVELDLIDKEGAGSFLSKQDAAQKLPIKRINPGSWVMILCGIYSDSPPSFDGTLSWKNPDGTRSKEEFTVFVP